MSFPTPHMNGNTSLSSLPLRNSPAGQKSNLPGGLHQMMSLGVRQRPMNSYNVPTNSAVNIKILDNEKSVYGNSPNTSTNAEIKFSSAQDLASALFPVSDHANHAQMQDMHTGLLNHTKNIENLNDFASKHYNMTQDTLDKHDTGLRHHTDVLQQQHTGIANHRDVLSKQHTALLQHKNLLEQQTAHVNALLESDGIKHAGLENHTKALNQFKMTAETHSNMLNDQHLGLLNHQKALQNMQDTQAKSETMLRDQDTGLMHHTEALNLQHTGLLNHQKHIRMQNEQSEKHTALLNEQHLGLENHAQVLQSNQETLKQLATQLSMHNTGLQELHTSTQAGLTTHKHTIDKLNANQQILAQHVNDLRTDLANLQNVTGSENNATNNLQLKTLKEQTNELRKVVTNNANILTTLMNNSNVNANNNMHQLMQRAPRMSR